MHIKVKEFITKGATKVGVISVHVKLCLCVAGTRVRARPRVGRWWVKMAGPFFNPSPSLLQGVFRQIQLLLHHFKFPLFFVEKTADQPLADPHRTADPAPLLNSLKSKHI